MRLPFRLQSLPDQASWSHITKLLTPCSTQPHVRPCIKADAMPFAPIKQELPCSHYTGSCGQWPWSPWWWKVSALCVSTRNPRVIAQTQCNSYRGRRKHHDGWANQHLCPNCMQVPKVYVGCLWKPPQANGIYAIYAGVLNAQAMHATCVHAHHIRVHT